jgi:hypothetical protein
MAMLAFEISKRQPLAEGRTFGATGPYEQIDGTVHFGVDPTHPDNRSIADIASAPRDSTNAPSFGERVLALATGKTRQELYPACPTIARTISASQCSAISARDGSVSATAISMRHRPQRSRLTRQPEPGTR